MPVFSSQVTDGSDDGQETVGVVNLTGPSLNANQTGHLSGMRFTNVTIPPGSTITAAALTLNLVSGSYDDPDVTIVGEAADHAAAFSTADDDFSDRPKTTASVTWVAVSLGLGAHATPDLSAVVQAIVNRAGWASGNALALFIQGNNSSSALRWSTAEASDGATLAITYTAPSGGVAVKALHYRRLMEGR